MLDRVIAKLYGDVFPHEGGHLPTTEDISYSGKKTKTNTQHIRCPYMSY